MAKHIVIIADHGGEGLKGTTLELLSVARRIQDVAPGEVSAIVMGARVEGPAQELARLMDGDVLALQVPELRTHNGEICKAVLGEVIPELNPAYVLAVHNTDTWEYIPGLAVRTGGVCVTGVLELSETGEGLVFQRAVNNGGLVAEVGVGKKPVFLTVQPGAFPPAAGTAGAGGQVARRFVSRPSDRCRSLDIRCAKPRSSVLVEADVVVAAGKGMGRKENLEMVRKLAALFPRSAVAGSRLVCDSGWLEYQCQVGLTGATVAPALYIACGISGAPQHLAGMAGSGFVVAINRDPNAAIFHVSDVCIVEDATTFIPALIQAIHERETR